MDHFEQLRLVIPLFVAASLNNFKNHEASSSGFSGCLQANSKPNPPFGPKVETTSLQFDDIQISPLAEGQERASQSFEIESTATKFFTENIADLQVEVTSSYSDSVHVYLKQIYKGKLVANGFGAVHLTQQGQVLSVSHSFGSPTEKFSFYKPWELLFVVERKLFQLLLVKMHSWLLFPTLASITNLFKYLMIFISNLTIIPKSIFRAYLFVDGKPVLVWDITIDLD
jgi:hypothetical protein